MLQCERQVYLLCIRILPVEIMASSQTADLLGMSGTHLTMQAMEIGWEISDWVFTAPRIHKQSFQVVQWKYYHYCRWSLNNHCLHQPGGVEELSASIIKPINVWKCLLISAGRKDDHGVMRSAWLQKTPWELPSSIGRLIGWRSSLLGLYSAEHEALSLDPSNVIMNLHVVSSTKYLKYSWIQTFAKVDEMPADRSRWFHSWWMAVSSHFLCLRDTQIQKLQVDPDNLEFTKLHRREVVWGFE